MPKWVSAELERGDWEPICAGGSGSGVGAAAVAILNKRSGS